MVMDLLATQQPSGAIKQAFGHGKEATRCNPCAPKSNEDYGSGEGPIMFSGNESVTDALYTLNFALIGLREAYGATGDQSYAEAEAKLVEYLVRIQVASHDHPE